MGPSRRVVQDTDGIEIEARATRIRIGVEDRAAEGIRACTIAHDIDNPNVGDGLQVQLSGYHTHMLPQQREVEWTAVALLVVIARRIESGP